MQSHREHHAKSAARAHLAWRVAWAEGRIVEMAEVDCKGRQAKFLKTKKETHIDNNGMFKSPLDTHGWYFQLQHSINYQT